MRAFADAQQTRGPASAWTMPALAADSIAFLQYTSGSTGDPKGVMVSHANLMRNCTVIQPAMDWNRDTAILTAAAMLGVDTCPMEGIEPDKFDEILALAGTNYTTIVACAAGYRAADDKYATTKKVRFKPDDVIVRI